MSARDLPPVLKRADFDTEEEYKDYLAVEAAGEAAVVDAPNLQDSLKAAARAHMKGERERISLMLPKRDLARLKAKALEKGMPYQTLINSVLHSWLAKSR